MTRAAPNKRRLTEGFVNRLKPRTETSFLVWDEYTRGLDPQAERTSERSADTFEVLANRYVEEYAKKENKSWKQAADLVRNNLLPKWGS
jgi:hypothetical protein